MDDASQYDVLIHSSEWLTTEADRLIKEYRSCKTMHAQRQLLPKLEYIKSHMEFETRLIEKLLEI
jgi:hypothetical protein